ncbi:hypothetical protein J2789_004845 [Variovorax paradoxus]|uniref:hypothetical protein n=1 Tax=Variovorax atrisoli TaxID=3394203 RepID=UPI0011A408B0|nr:hypothetical protein [Variovorax paradoxus]MDR6522155.1 hypothetical protein [Variovorax paradoxus]
MRVLTALVLRFQLLSDPAFINCTLPCSPEHGSERVKNCQEEEEEEEEEGKISCGPLQARRQASDICANSFALLEALGHQMPLEASMKIHLRRTSRTQESGNTTAIQ